MKTDIEYAALAMGFDDAELDAVTGTIITVHLPGLRCFWRPLDDDGDSRRLERACVQWMRRNSYTAEVGQLADDMRLARLGEMDYEDRAAVFALAVAIGKVIDGGNK